MRSGQAEIIILVGIIIVAVIALVSQLPREASPVPSGVAQQQKAVKDSVLSLASSSAGDIVRVMEEHGGYLSVEVLEGLPYSTVDGVAFLGQGVPYWQQCENVLAPSEEQMENWLATGVEQRVRDGLAGLRQDGVRFDDAFLDAEAAIHDDKIEVSVNLPTEVEGYEIPQPYRATLPTRLGRISQFGRDMAAEAAATRFLEWHALASIYFSPSGRGGEPQLPTSGFLLNCGETVIRTPQTLGAAMQDAVSYSLASTLFWEPRPLSATDQMVFAVEDLQGKTYPDLDFGLYFPDAFQYQFLSPIIITNPEFDYVLEGTPFTTPVCQSGYVQKYNVDIPVVVSAKDDLTGGRFSFALQGAIRDPGPGESMAPGSCGEPAAREACQQASCPASVTVTDTLGSPLPGVSVVFQDCFVGETNSQGLAEGQAACGFGDLVLFHEGAYDTLVTETDSALLNPASFQLPKKPRITVRFEQVAESSCATSPVDNEFVTVILGSLDGWRNMSLNNLDPAYTGPVNCATNDQFCLAQLAGHLVDETSTDLVASGKYEFDSWITNPEMIADYPRTHLPILLLQDSIRTIPAQDNVTLVIRVPKSEHPLGYAAKCLEPPAAYLCDPNQPTLAQAVACTPEITTCFLESCLACVNGNQRLAWTAEHFYSGTGPNDRSLYERSFRQHLDACDLGQVEVL